MLPDKRAHFPEGRLRFFLPFFLLHPSALEDRGDFYGTLPVLPEICVDSKPHPRWFLQG